MHVIDTLPISLIDLPPNIRMDLPIWSRWPPPITKSAELVKPCAPCPPPGGMGHGPSLPSGLCPGIDQQGCRTSQAGKETRVVPTNKASWGAGGQVIHLLGDSLPSRMPVPISANWTDSHPSSPSGQITVLLHHPGQSLRLHPLPYWGRGDGPTPLPIHRRHHTCRRQCMLHHLHLGHS